jgi:hypothetical protein
MRRGILAGWFCAGLTLMATPLVAQRVSADVVVRSGPVAGHVIVTDRNPSYGYRRVIVDRDAPARVIVVERLRHGRGKRWRQWEHGYRVVTVYYARGRYYDRLDRHYPGLEEVVVYERNGRFYRDD